MYTPSSKSIAPPKAAISHIAPILLLLLAGAALHLHAATGTLMPAPWLYALDGNGATISNAKVCIYVAGTSTAATTYSDAALTVPNPNPVRADASGRVGPIYLVPGSSYKVVYQDATGTAACDGNTLRTQDNIQAVPTSAATVDVLGTAGESFTAGQAVYLSDGSGSKTAGQWYKADATNAYSAITPVVGLVPSAVTSGAVGTIRLAGSVTGLSGLAIGSDYFVSTAGALTTTAPGYRRYLGRADSATSLVLAGNPGLAPLVGTMTDGQLILGSSSAGPQVGTLGASNGITATTGSGTLALAGTLYDRATTVTTVANTVTETTLYSKTINANDLTGKLLRFRAVASLTNSTGGNVTYELRVKFGGVTVFDSNAQTVAGTFSGISPHKIEAAISSQDATHEVGWAYWEIPGGTISNGAAYTTTTPVNGGHNAIGATLTNANTFTVTIQLGTAAAGATFSVWGAVLEIL